MNRRGFLTACLATFTAPAIVRADSLMRIVPRETVVEMGWLETFRFIQSPPLTDREEYMRQVASRAQLIKEMVARGALKIGGV